MDQTRATPLSDIRRDFDRVSPAIVQQASAFAASILADVAGRRGTMDGRIVPLTPATRLAGPAFTIEGRPGDNLMIHAAMAMAKPGDILVVDGKADTGCALMGAIMITACKVLGLGGVAVNPGDLIVGDADGVVVVEREKCSSILGLAAQKVEDERTRIAEIVSGATVRPKWLDGALRAAGVLRDGETL